MICPKCGSEMADGSKFCTKCGALLSAQTGAEAGQGNPQPENPNMQRQNSQPGNGNPNNQPYGNPNGQPYGNPNGQPYGNPNGQPYADPKDHTAEFAPQDISSGKVIAMLPYLLGIVGVLIALLMAKESPYVSFHVRQSLKITVCNTLIGIAAMLLCWTVIVPIAGAVCIVILLIVRIISFVQICSGKAKEPAIVSSFGFLR